jgi:hypothetical protein
MGLLSDFFIASDHEATEYHGDEIPSEADRYQFKRITPLEAAAFLAAIRGVDDRIPLLDEFVLLTPEDAEEWTVTIPEDMTAGLAALQPQGIAELARELAHRTEEELGWTAEEFEPVVSALADLARRAQASGRRMYLWNCL